MPKHRKRSLNKYPSWGARPPLSAPAFGEARENESLDGLFNVHAYRFHFLNVETKTTAKTLDVIFLEEKGRVSRPLLIPLT